ncbi:AAA family ATPase [Burkholderia contaminans]|uniref:DNA replication and repair protein RecF n=1 Tax=Burkholderia contaminans TaxID=488447 RepID=A0A6P2XMR0_9BURK|nr:ATP-binding protein [Burkholderia contaminans]VWD10574.1 DNA replication and repair protein RecF [Burkholderia contaminans]
MIKSFRIHNFRTCRDVVVTDTSHSTLLIGRNGAGKTNILSALEWVAETAVDGRMSSILPFMEGSSVTLELELGERRFLYTLGARKPADVHKSKEMSSLAFLYDDHLWEITPRSKQPKLIFERVADEITIVNGRRRQTVSVPPSLVRTFDLALSVAGGTKAWQLIKDVRDFLIGIRYYALDDLRARAFYIRQDQYNSWLQDEDTVPGGDAVLYRLIRLHQEKREIFDEISHILGKDELNIISNIRVTTATTVQNKKRANSSEVDHAIPDALSKIYSVQFYVPSSQSSVVNYPSLSFGTRRILQLIVALLYDRSTVMLVEQPEDGIHPGLLGKLMRVIHGYASPTQFFMTSHSPSVVNSIPAKNLRIVMNVNGETTCRPLTTEELDDAKKFINEEGQLAEYVRLLEQ